MGQVVFDPTAFYARYPEFAAVSTASLQAYFNEACLYLSNADNSPIQDLTRRALLFNMLVAHIAFIGGALNADGQPRPVGILAAAAEGSVSASFQNVAPTPGTGAWFQQSQYGAAFWQATTAIRGFQYRPRCTRY